MQLCIQIESESDRALLQSFVEMSADRHLELLREDPEFAEGAAERGHTKEAVERLLVAFDCFATRR